MDIALYGLFIVAIIISLYAQIKVSSTFKKYSGYPTFAGRNATDVAGMILKSSGVYGVSLGRVAGSLTDHYNPKTRTLALSDTVFASTSAAAIGVAAHEAGHAVQHSVGYFPIKLRSALVPVTNFASRTSWLFILLGGFISAVGMFDIGYYVLLAGLGLFAVTTLFQLVTLPCEFNASRRAMTALRECGWYSEDELTASRKVLSAAAMTYVAATLVSAIQLLRLVLIFTRGRNNNGR